MKFWNEILRANSGTSSNRLLMLVFAGVFILFGVALFVVEIKENNIKLLEAIIDGLVVVIVGVSGATAVSKFRNVKKKENNE